MRTGSRLLPQLVRTRFSSESESRWTIGSTLRWVLINSLRSSSKTGQVTITEGFCVVRSIEVSASKVRPRVWIGVLIWLGYSAVVALVQGLSGLPYTAWGDTGDTLFRGAGISLIVGAILLVITTTILGWWRPALFEQERSRHRWPIIAPLLLLVLTAVNLFATEWESYDAAFFGASLVLLLVGFTEEVTTRGLLLVALRSRFREMWVWLLSSIAFGLMHYINLFQGQDFGATSQQVWSAFLAGTTFYVLRRVTGSLVWAMILHGLWDFSVFAVGHAGLSVTSVFVGLAEPLPGVIALISLPWVLRGATEDTTRHAHRRVQT